MNYGSSAPRLFVIEGDVPQLTRLMARWGPVPHDTQVELMLGSYTRSQAVCANPALSPAAVSGALAAGSVRDAQRVAENILCGPRFADLPLRLVVRCAGLAGFEFDYHAGIEGLALVLARRPAVPRALLAGGRPSPAALAALCMPDVDWHADEAAALIRSFPASEAVYLERALQGRARGPRWAARRLMPPCTDPPENMRSPREIASLARLVVEGTSGGAGAGPRPLLIATGLLANPRTPRTVRTGLETLVGRGCGYFSRLLPWAERTEAEERERLSVEAAFDGASPEVWAAAQVLVTSGFEGSLTELAATAARLV